MASILVVDDERAIRNTLQMIFEPEGYTVSLAEDGADAIAKFGAGQFDLVLTDYKLPKKDGMEVLEHIKAQSPDTQVIMFSGHGDIETAVTAMKLGACDYLEKPIDLQRCLTTVRNAIEKKNLVAENKTLAAANRNLKVENTSLKERIGRSYKMIGDSEPMRRMLNDIAKVAPTNSRVLILGENGAGKELAARAIYEASGRAAGPFVEVNCAAIPSELIESELFGHKKGAFTGADKDKTGKFEEANGGTLFLDEIGDMSLAAQAKVLKALEDKKITRVGDNKEIKVDVRVLAATNKNLEAAIKEGTFREDLYHRLAVIFIDVPSLNDRRDDIPALADHFLELAAADMNMTRKKITAEAVEALKQIDWSGNIREFRNAIERLTILAPDATITAQDIEAYARPLSRRR